MYKYDQYDQAMVDARVEEFRDQARRRLEGKLTEDQFKPLRLMNGLYLQLHAYMLRVAIPYGTLDSRQMHALADISDKYDRGYGHFTTRQNIQYNWIRLEDAADILADLAKVEMHAIQTSGNCIRNISSDHFAGAAADEVVDPRPYAELLRQWSSFHPEFSYLPRKFKIAVIASEKDRAAMRLHDIGINIVKNDAGELGAAFYVGGGMGRTPMIAPCINQFVPLDQLVTYCEACLRVYNRYGRRDNKYKARIKILVKALTPEGFAERVEQEPRDRARVASRERSDAEAVHRPRHQERRPPECGRCRIAPDQRRRDAPPLAGHAVLHDGVHLRARDDVGGGARPLVQHPQQLHEHRPQPPVHPSARHRQGADRAEAGVPIDRTDDRLEAVVVKLQQAGLLLHARVGRGGRVLAQPPVEEPRAACGHRPSARARRAQTCHVDACLRPVSGVTQRLGRAAAGRFICIIIRRAAAQSTVNAMIWPNHRIGCVAC